MRKVKIMNVLKINFVNPQAGAFAAVPTAGDIPAGASYALVQICRASVNGAVVNNPAQMLNWQQAGNQIKQATLDVSTGWFVDNLQLAPPQANLMYYMCSFAAANSQAYLQALQDAGEDEGGVLYMNNNAAQGVSGQVFGQQYAGHMVAAIAQTGQYPIIYDAPQQQPGTVLNFQVFLVYVNAIGGQQLVGVSKGFTWTYDANRPTSSFNAQLNGATPEFVGCMQRVVNYQNQTNHTNWQLQV